MVSFQEFKNEAHFIEIEKDEAWLWIKIVHRFVVAKKEARGNAFENMI